MKILHITASYKPAFIYGGPIYSVAALCEAIKAEGEKLKAEGGRKVESEKSKVKRDLVSEENLPFTEELQRSADNGENVKSQKSKVKSELNSGENLFITENLQRPADCGQNTLTIQVSTTLANGREELPYQSGETKLVDRVAVTYFKRITKDHSHCSPALLKQLWKNAKQYDIIHIHSWWNLVSMGAVIVCLLRGIRPIVSPRGMLGDYTLSKPKALFHRLIGKYLLRNCNFHATTAMEADEILKRVFNGGSKVEVVNLMSFGEVKSEKWKVKSKKNKEQGTKNKEQRAEHSLKGAPSLSERAGVRLFIIHNLVKLPVQLPVKTRVFDGSLKLIFLSRIHPKKGIELLLDALALVDFPFSLSIIGEGDFEYVESLKWKVESGKFKDKVNWTGAVYGDEKYQLLADHDAFILPSYNENFANVVIEAIAVGTPVLLSEHVGLQDYVKANQYGLVFKLDELKSSLDHAYRLFSEGRLSIDSMGLIDKGILTDKYLEMYNECSL